LAGSENGIPHRRHAPAPAARHSRGLSRLRAGGRVDAHAAQPVVRVRGARAPPGVPRSSRELALLDERMANFRVAGGDSIDPHSYQVLRVYVETQGVPPGKYLVDSASREIRYVVDPGIGGRIREYGGRQLTRLDSPKATLMALITD